MQYIIVPTFHSCNESRRLVIQFLSCSKNPQKMGSQSGSCNSRAFCNSRTQLNLAWTIETVSAHACTVHLPGAEIRRLGRKWVSYLTFSVTMKCSLGSLSSACLRVTVFLLSYTRELAVNNSSRRKPHGLVELSSCPGQVHVGVFFLVWLRWAWRSAFSPQDRCTADFLAQA